MDNSIDELSQAAQLAGFKAECGGGGDTVLFLSTPDGYTVAFGYSNGPLGFTVFTDSEQGDVLDGDEGGGDMEGEGHTVEQQAAYIRKVAGKWKAFQTW